MRPRTRPPHPSLSTRQRPAELLLDSPLNLWRNDISTRGIFTAEKLAALAVVLGIIFSQVGFIVGPVAAAPDVRGDWRFDEPSGSVAVDSGSLGNDGNYVGPATRGDGIVGTGLDLTGADDWVIVPDPVDGSLDFGSGDFTISLWAKTTQVPASGAYPELVYKRTDGGSSTGFEMYLIESEANRLAFDIHDNGTQVLTRGTPIDDGQWHHIAAVRGSSVVLYIDGIEVDSAVDTLGDISNSRDLFFGRDELAFAWSEFDGNLDEIKIYERALSAGEVAALANPPFVVNSTADVVDNNIGDGSCDTGNTVGPDPECTLRAAIQEANASAVDEITLPAGIYTLTIAGTGDDAAVTGDLDITSDLTITGAGASTTTINAGGIDRVFHLVSGTATVSGVTVTGGSAGEGAGFMVEWGLPLNIVDSILVGNDASVDGGAIQNQGVLTLTDSEVSSNSAVSGGGIRTNNTATLARVLLTANTAEIGGGVRNTGDLTIINSTVSGNTATTQGGGLGSSGDVWLTNVTITANDAPTGGGIFEGSGSNKTYPLNSIIAGNTGSSGLDVSGTMESLGFNIVGDIADSSGWVGSDQTGIDPLLQPLADNGGLTMTHALTAASPAIDAGDDTACVGPDNDTDQRGEPRPVDYEQDAIGPFCDIGAFEAPLPSLTNAISGTVFEDIVGDVLNDGTIDDANNPGAENVDVYLYLDDGSAVLDAGDTLIGAAPIQTDVNGGYSFTGLADGDYFVVVDSKTFASSQDPTAVQGDIWAEQTYGPAGGYCDNGIGYSVRVSAGPCYAGIASSISDDFSQWDDREHRAELTVSGGDISNVDFGFSFNVVTNTVGGNAVDYDLGANRTVQGSLRQFIQNANAITGPNTMRFVPAEAAGIGDGSGNWWWRLMVTTALPTITGDGTTIDGRALDFTNGTTVLNTNAAQIGAGVAVGTDGTYTTPKLDPELEIRNFRPTTVLPTGLVFEADDSVLRHVSIWGFGDSASTFDTNVKFGTNYSVDPDFTGSLAEFNVIGTGPASFTDPGAADRSGQMNLTMRETDNAIVRDNLIGFAGGEGVATSTGSASLSVLRNEIRRNGILDPIANPVSVWISGSVIGNLITDNASGVSSGSTLWITYEDNTITANGWGGTRPHGIQVSGSPTTIRRNIIADNAGSGVVLGSTDTDVYVTRNSMYGNGTVTGSIGIDLLASGDDSQAAPFVTLNDAGDGDTGSNGLLNYPVLDTARIEGSDLVVTGWARPGTTIEFYLADSDPSGFGEGETWLISKIEGSADDTDATTGTYGPGPVNGTAQGTDTTNRFAFTIPTASLAAAIAVSDQLTALATSGTNTSEFGANMAVTGSTVPGAIWRRSGQNTPFSAGWDGSSFGGAGMSQSVGEFRIIQGAESPSRGEAIVVGVTEGGTIAGEMWDGTFWSALPTLGTTTQSYWWGFDVAYEPVSGDAVVVYADGADLNYRVWNGATWSNEAAVPEPPGGTPRQMQLAAHPYSDEMVLVVSNDSSQDYAVVWDGSAWGNGVTLDSTGSGNDRTDVYVAYEQQSGEALVTYGTGITSVSGRVWNGTSWSGESSVLKPSSVTGVARWTTLASEPGSDRIVMGVATYANEIWMIVWTGDNWYQSGVATTTSTGSTEPAVAVAFEGTSGQALITYGEAVSTPRYRTWSLASDWSGELSAPDIGGVSNSMMLYPEPGTDGVMLGVNDDDSDLHLMYWDGSAWGVDNELETNTGDTKNQPFLFLWEGATGSAPSSVVTVNSTGDSADDDHGDHSCDTGGMVGADPECTMRAAIEEANASGIVDSIAFNIPASDSGHLGGVWTIAPSGVLPSIGSSVTIDGGSQPGFVANTNAALAGLNGSQVIAIDGSVGGTADGLRITGDDVVVKGLVIGGFPGRGLLISGDDAVVSSVYVGTTVSGSTANPNTGNGISVTGARVAIGGAGVEDRFLVSGNGAQGIQLSGVDAEVSNGIIGLNASATQPRPNGANGITVSGTTGATLGAPGAGNIVSGNNLAPATADGIYVTGGGAHTIQANLIGTNSAGDSLGNYNAGIALSDTTGVTIGGTGAGEGNVLSANGSFGIAISGAAATLNTIVGNYIGTDPAGTSDLGNGTDGVAIRNGATDNTVGGTTSAHRNYIAGNDNDGVWITGSGTELNKVQGNWIGYGSDGSALGNDYHGVAVEFDAADNLIGGDTAAAANRIGNSGWDGITFNGGNGAGNAALRNEITNNVGLGIDIDNDGVTPNDAGDVDTGDNDVLNFPVITSATESGGTVTVGFDLDVSDGSYRIEFFDNASADPSGNGEGENFIDSVDVSVASGIVTPASHTFAGSAGDIITATTTEGTAVPFGSTSEFSAVYTVTVPSNPPVLNAIAPQPGSEGSSITFTASATDPDGPAGLSFTLVDGPVDAVPGGASINLITGAFSWVPTEVQGPGVYEFYVRVTDGTALFDQQLVTFTISEVNSWPVLDPIGNQTTDEQTLLTFTATASDTDVPANTLTFSLSGQPAGASIAPLTGVFTWTPTEAQGPNVYTFDVVVTDNGSPARSDLETINVTVNEDDLVLPVITLTGANPQTIEVGSAYSELGATALDDVDGDISGSIAINSGAVNTAVLGSYSVTYDVSDSSGNAAVQVTRTVNVVDTTVPVITLTGANPQTIEVGSAYSELGATASDSYDGDISGSIVINSSAVNTAVVGSYVVTYDVVDSSGNPASGIRTVDVVDTTAPVITLLGSSPQIIEVGTAYSELGATASDNYDGDISGSISINSSGVNTSLVGSYSVTYDVTDSESNAAVQVVRTVDVVDSVAPIITLLGANPQVIEVGTAYAELGATAIDVGDGDLTGSIVVDSSAVNTAVVGSYSVTYDVTDSESNAAVQAVRTVDVVDTTLPVITLVGANPQTVEVGAAYSELGATASDNYDGDITVSIVINSVAVNTSAVGSYSVTYNVSDANGNAAVQVTRTVDVVDTTVPVITLVGANPQTIEVGAAYSELGATAFDVGDGDLTGAIVINSVAVNTLVVGSYSVTYDVTDSESNAAVQVTRTVDVVDTTVPVITLVGANPQTIEVGAAYSELGATASDNYDGDISGSIVINSVAVNTAVVGSYVVMYDVVDSSGNPANGIRTVEVVDTTAPVIALVGANPQTIEVGAAYSELGATASDSYDGDISGSIVINSAAVNTAVVGSYSVTYDVSDSSGNAAVRVIRTVNVVDTTAPVITLTGANPQTIEVGAAYFELGATAFDVGDGDLTGAIVINSVAVNTLVVGSYSVTYDVTDSESNAAVQVTRTVNVVDTTVPVITLTGPNPQTIEVGSAYSELGAIASDNYDGDISGSIVINSAAVNTAVVGSYSVTYNVSDANGNAAVQVTRTVNVVDTTAPVITLLGADPVTVEVGTPYVDAGATAFDVGDGDLTGSMVTVNPVDHLTVGSYLVTYDVSDSQGTDAAQVTRTVNVVDTTAPVITLLGADPQLIEIGSGYTELGATAADSYDGDISVSIVIDPSAVDTATVGSYLVTYDVDDAAGNSAVQVTRTVNVVDTTAPVITLLGADPVTVEVGTAYVDAGATAFDVGDGDLTGSIVTVNPVDHLTVGSYLVTYDVSDSQGIDAAQVTRTVNVVDTTAPVITLLGADPVTVEVGTAYVDAGATAWDIGDGDLTGSIVTVNPVDHLTVGSYLVTYDVDDAAGNSAVQVTRTVNVVDTTAPVITLLGANPQTIEAGTAYSELGATAFDNYDGDISGSLAINASAVNTSIVGSYSVTYDVTDANGNAAVQVTRTVDVVDTTLPTITLLGANPQIIEVGTAYSELGATASDNYDGDISLSIVIDSAAVNTAAVGSYSVTYNVTDANGNAAVQVTRTVDVVDTTLPTITLLGANPQTIEVAAAYSELGATASDNYDGDISLSIVIDPSAVNTAVVGSYSVTYNVTDANGNAAAQVTRTVDVVDTTLPTITLLGANPQIIEVGTAYSELGATASDNYDGDISGSIVINSAAVNTSVVGSYSVTYNVTDANGNAAAQVTRTVNVVDTTAPIITLLGANPQTIQVGSAYTELGATAFDVGDGDVTVSIVIDPSAVNTTSVGSYSVTYDVSDSQGNAAVQVTRTVDVVDTTLPIITLLGANPQIIEVGGAYSELGATASDNYDGDITGSIVVNSAAANTAVVGSYTVTYDVADSEGNPAAQVTRTVDVVDTTLPTITLLGANPQVIEVGAAYSDLGATASDNYDGDISGSIVINSSAVNTSVVGSYSVTYNVTDANGNAAVQVTRTVNVVDTSAPVITLVGANPQVIEIGAAYVELGATASDGYDGDITGSIVINATAVNIAAIGSYVVTYDVVDSSGNPASAFRTVNVVDTTAPVITLLGANPQIIEVGTAYSELGATASDNLDGDITGSIVFDSAAVNSAAVGSYVVTYDVVDSEGNAAIQVVRTVDVVDTTLPTITLLGANPQTIPVTSPYVELGATASDNYDGDISGSIAINSSAVNTALVGSYVVTYDVADANGNVAVQVVRTVNVVNVAPTLGAIGNQTVDEGTGVTFTATATDPDPTDPLTFSLSGAPAGTAIDPVTGVFSWTPTEGQGPNVFTFAVVVTDAGTPPLSDSQVVTITVDEVNTVPVLGVVGPQAVDELALLTFVVAATDSDLPANTLSYSLAGSPPGAGIDGAGVFTWTPTETQGPGVYTFDVVVTDDGSPSLGAIQPATVTVGEVNAAPNVTSPGNQSSAENDAVSLTVVAGDVDVPANSLSFAAIGLPDGLSINAATGEIVGTIAYTANATSPFTTTVTVTDDGAPARSTQVTFNWTVADTNRPPVAVADSVSAIEDTTQVFAVLANDTDPDGDPRTLASVTQSAHGTTSIVPGGISYLPDSDYFGADSFTYTIADGRGGSDSATVTVTVVPVNDRPVLSVPSSLTVDEGTTAVFAASATDIEGDGVAFSLTGAPAGASINPASGVFDWTPTEAQGPGSFTIDVVATDNGVPSLAATRQVSVNVAEVNVAPTVTNPGLQTTAENTPAVLAVVATDVDVPANTLSYTATGLPDGLTIDASGGVISGTPSFDAAAGSPYSVTVTATDDGSPSRSSQTTFTWRVVNTNRPPAAVDMSIFASAGIPTSLVLNGSDPDGDALTFSIDVPPAHGALTGGPRLYDYAPLVTASGDDVFTFTVSDGQSQASGTVSVEIAPNLPPSGGSDQYTVRRGGVLVVDAPGVMADDSDPEGEPITVSLDSTPESGTVTLEADGSFVYSHDGSDGQRDHFTYVVDDGMRFSAPITVSIFVEENLVPQAVDDFVVLDEDTRALIYPLQNDSDPNTESLILTDVGAPLHGSVEWSIDGVVIYRPAPDWNGTETITYRVSDGDLSVTGLIMVTVRPVNDPPLAIPVDLSGNSGETLIVDLRPYVTDIDDDELVFLLEPPPDGSVTESEPGVFELNLDGVVRDLPPLTFVVSDPHDEKATSLLTVTVKIPAELVGVPSLVSEDLDPVPPTSGDSPEPSSPLLLAGLRLMVGSVLETFQALRIPLAVLLLFLLASLYMGLSGKFIFASTPTILPLGRKRRVDIVMAQSQAGVPARADGGTHQEIIHRFGPEETGIITTGARLMIRSEVWVEVETPEGDGWVNAEFLTEQIPVASFIEDDRPTELVANFVDRIYGSDDLLATTAGHDLHVAYYGPPIRFAANSLARLLRGASVYSWWQSDGDAPQHQGTFAETVGESITTAFRNRDAHSADSVFSIPTEFVNMHSLVLGHHEYGEGWRVFFRYEDDEPSVAGLMREAEPNRASMLGDMRKKTA